MAVSTRNRRMSMMSMGRPFVPRLPVPSGAFNTGPERAQLVYRYSGLLPELFVGSTTVGTGLDGFATSATVDILIVLGP
jgi:hypothetical protein